MSLEFFHEAIGKYTNRERVGALFEDFVYIFIKAKKNYSTSINPSSGFGSRIINFSRKFFIT